MVPTQKSQRQADGRDSLVATPTPEGSREGPRPCLRHISPSTTAPPNYKGQQPSPLWSTGAHRILGTRQCCRETIPLRGRRAWLPSPPPEPPPEPRDGDFSAASHFPTSTQDSLCSCTVRLTPLILSYMGGCAQCLIFPLPDDLEIQNLCVCVREGLYFIMLIFGCQKSGDSLGSRSGDCRAV